MKRILKAILALSILGSTMWNAQAQSSTIIATGTPGTPQHNAGPIYRSSASSAYNASRYVYLYTSSELAAAGIAPGDLITSAGWRKANAAMANGPAQIRIYLRETSAVSFSATTETWANLNAGATLVHQDLNFVVPATQSPNFIVFPFSQAFVYNGGSLEVSVEFEFNSFSGNPSTGTFDWEWTTVVDRIYGQGNTNLSGMGNLSSTSNSISTIDDRRPIIQFEYTSGVSCTGQPLGGTAVASP